MWAKWLQLLGGFLCGYLFIKWFPIAFSLHISDMVVDFLFHPIEFFAASIVFIIGFIAYADLIQYGTKLFALFFYYKKILILELLLTCSVMISFLILFIFAFWHTIVFFCFSILYGMISLDFQKHKTTEDKSL